MTRTLILAAGAGWGELAARFVAGDAVIHIGDPVGHDVDAVAASIDDVVISGDLADGEWLSASFDVADRLLGSGRRVTVILADGDPDQSDDGGASATSTRPVPLPDVIAGAWRVVGLTVEHPVTGVSFQRAADVDGTTEAADGFRLAQIVGHAYRHPETYVGLLEDRARHPTPAWRPGNLDDELALLRRQLAVYKNSKLGRLTTRYWQARRSIVGRLRKRHR